MGNTVRVKREVTDKKTACLNIFCQEQGLHFFLNETWQQEGDFAPLIELVLGMEFSLRAEGW